ncbi:alpha/beta hydrolase [Filobacillus milosensis]|uniref:Alpha/beta hydrolase n=2 Tax=Filobacillus milosensis TaxID=94137 RepID=A0A4Y8IGB4_9BACI|nr:alpha/beta hydrolase [Filobacillus milosensis]
MYKHDNPLNDTWVVLLHGLGGNSVIWKKQIESFTEHYNVITIDLPGHYPNEPLAKWEFNNSFEICADMIMDVLNHHYIQKAHLVGISLGSVIIHQMIQQYPNRIASAVLGGAITEFNWFSKMLLKAGNYLKKVLPYIWLYAIFAHVIMPRKHHKKARWIFIREAKKMGSHAFLKWFSLANDITRTPIGVNESSIPRLYLSGSEDYLFISKLNEFLENDSYGELVQIPECGHVCNIEKPEMFNKLTIGFMNQQVNLERVRKVSN